MNLQQCVEKLSRETGLPLELGEVKKKPLYIQILQDGQPYGNLWRVARNGHTTYLYRGRYPRNGERNLSFQLPFVTLAMMESHEDGSHHRIDGNPKIFLDTGRTNGERYGEQEDELTRLFDICELE